MTDRVAGADVFSQMGAFLKRATSWIARAAFGVFVVAAAGVALIATTVLGVFLTVAALCLKAAHSFGRAKPTTRRRASTGQSGDTLDATRTADGWVIDPHAPKAS